MKTKLLSLFLILSIYAHSQKVEYGVIEAGIKASTYQGKGNLEHYILGPSIGIEAVQEFGPVGAFVIGLRYHHSGMDVPRDQAGNQFTDHIRYLGLHTAARLSFWKLSVDLGGSVVIDVGGDLTYTINGEDATQGFEQNIREIVTNDVFAYGGLWYAFGDRKWRIGATYEHGLNDIYTNDLEFKTQGVTLKVAMRL